MKSFNCLLVTILGLILNSSETTFDRNTRLFDSVLAARSFAWPASFSASSALSFKVAISKPEIMLIPRAAITSMMIPPIRIRQPRSISDLYFSIISAKMSGLKLCGGSICSARFSISNPRQTIMPPDMDKKTSSQNHGEEISFKSKFIYAFLISIPQLILLVTFVAIIFRHQKTGRK